MVEEAPAPLLDPEARAQVLQSLVLMPVSKSTTAAPGTFEFLYEDGHFYFIEMNTRVQVEHPVSEMVTGIDIVKEQLRIASGHASGHHAGRRKAAGPRLRMPYQR